MSGRRGIRVGVDIGGTFTDVALEHPGGRSSAKLLTDYERPERAILPGSPRRRRRPVSRCHEIGQVIHGTTLVTNALIQRRGAKTAFITTEGFRDVIEMRSENRFEQYDLNLELPAPLIAREHRYTLSERIAADGSVLLPLDGRGRGTGERIAEGGYEAVAVGLMHAYANDIHECMVADALRRAAPGLAVSISSVVSPQMRELPRFNTVIANAYVQPLVSDYLGRLVAELKEAGIDAPVFLMHSGGGLVSVETAIDQPVRLLESGPAGGAIYAAGVARGMASTRRSASTWAAPPPRSA
jgi:N-methylhydantoinase A